MTDPTPARWTMLLILVMAAHPSAWAAPPQTASLDCVPDSSCPGGQTPPSCCQPPPCEYYQQLEGKKILQSVHRNRQLRDRLLDQARREYLQETGKAAAQLGPEDQARIAAEATAKLVSYLDCASMPKADRREYVTARYRTARYGEAEGPLTPEDQAEIDREVRECERPRYLFGNLRSCRGQRDPDIGIPPGFSNDAISCQVLDEDGEPRSREGAHLKYATCEEFIDASYEHELHHKAICSRKNSTERGQAGIDDFMKEEVDAYQKEIDYLKSQLEGWVSACSPAMNAAERREAAKQGIGVLGKRRGK